MNKKYRVGIITFPRGSVEAGVAGELFIGPQLKLIHVLEPLCDEIIWLATNYTDIEERLPPKATIFNIHSKYYLEYKEGKTPFLNKVYQYLMQQKRIMFSLFKLRKRVDILIFAFGTDLYIFPMLFGKILRKKIIIRSDGRPSVTLKKYYEISTKRKIILFEMIEKLSYSLADKLVPESRNNVDFYNLHKYQKKIAYGSQYIEAPFFRIDKKLAERTYRIGFISRHFSKGKGVLEFTQSLSQILKTEDDKAIMIGDGDLKENVIQILADNSIQNNVILTGRIKHEELISYLNNTQIIVVPSYTEGLSNLILEAMGCGCIVVATPVGGTPDVIKDSETGFIIEIASPECIANNIIRAMNHPDLEKIGENAHKFVKDNYCFEAAVERYRSILTKLA